MSVVWLIEKPSESGLMLALSGDFAVRVFASTRSLSRFFSLRNILRPEAVIIAIADVTPIELGVISIQIAKSTTKLILLGAREEFLKMAEAMDIRGWNCIDSNGERFRISLELQRILAVGGTIRQTMFRYKDLSVDEDRSEVSIGGASQSERLSLKEVRLLKYLLERSGETLSRDQIKMAIWPNISVCERTIDSHISRIRTKIDGSEVEIRSVYGGGYVLR